MSRPANTGVTISRTTLALATRRLALTLAVATLAACGGGGDGATGPSTQATLRINNTSSRTITRVNFNPCTASSWGDERLNSGETIAPGANRSWKVTPGCYDVRVLATGGDTGSWYDEQLTAGQTHEINTTQASPRRGAYAIGDAKQR